MARPSKYSPELRERAVAHGVRPRPRAPVAVGDDSIRRREVRLPRPKRSADGCARPSATAVSALA
jgi:hypothetical protein